MKGFFFYLEYPDKKSKRAGTRKKPGNHSGNVVATIPGTEYQAYDHRGGHWCIATVSAVFNWPDSAVCGSVASIDYIQDNCKRISEAQARTIHPNLFNYLGSDKRPAHEIKIVTRYGG